MTHVEYFLVMLLVEALVVAFGLMIFFTLLWWSDHRVKFWRPLTTLLLAAVCLAACSSVVRYVGAESTCEAR